MNTADIDFRSGTRTEKRLSGQDVRRICQADMLDGSDLHFVDGVTTPDRLIPNRIVFIDRFDTALAHALAHSDVRDVLVLAIDEYRAAIPQPRIISQQPRLHFSKLVRALFNDDESAQTVAIDPTARIHESAKLSVGVTIGAGSEIGEGTYIYPNVVIGRRVTIGKNCVIKSGTVIGQPGFGMHKDGEGIPRHLPHVAGVVLQDDVELGALNTVASGTIHPTVVEAHVKTDDHVHIAHNCHIGARTLITACAELSGSVRVGTDCWIGPNASVRDGLTIGDRAYVGIAANVVKSVRADATVYGNPARERTSS